jgi:hypothetical protein
MYGLLRDLRSGVRLLTKAPDLAIFAAVAIATANDHAVSEPVAIIYQRLAGYCDIRSTATDR